MPLRLALLCCTLTTLSMLASLTAVCGEDAANPASEAYFENKIRPLLVEHCIDCHGPKNQEANVRLDSAAHAFAKIDSGHLIVVGKSGESRLKRVVEYRDDDIQMPPKGKLSDAAIAELSAWIDAGAKWPKKEGEPTDAGPNLRDPQVAREKHWAFQPFSQALPPKVKSRAKIKTPIDQFLLAKLEEVGLDLNPQVDRAKWIRRVTFDLHGLPPTFEEVKAFIADSSSNAEAKLVERLLASPRYGERWGRHWLDVARYADTKGYVFTDEHRYPYAYTYRDWVIDAFNKDLPYDQFVQYQLAADQLDAGPDKVNLAALGFLTTGRRYLNNTHDIIDDRIDVTMRGFLGMTVQCARCHDHKFDPISINEYYGMYGIFQASYEPEEFPEIGKPGESQAYKDFLAELAKREKVVDEIEAKGFEKVQHSMRHRVGEILQLLVKQSSPARDDAQMKIEGEEPQPKMVGRWRDWLNSKRDQNQLVFGVWYDTFGVKKEEFPAKLDELIKKAGAEGDARKPIHPLVLQKLNDKKPANIYDLARLYGDLFREIGAAWAEQLKTSPDAKSFLEEPREQLRLVLYGDNSPTSWKLDEGRQAFDRAMNDELRAKRKHVEELKVTAPGAPPRAMVMLDKDKIGGQRVFQRGNPGRQGDEVPRQFLKVLKPDAQPFKKGSGRLELAQSITGDSKELAARVMVNRIWQQHFGQGLVRTASDFGVRGEPPTHPELLDYLAKEFIKSGWSVKAMHRLILKSAVYRQTSFPAPKVASIDPENRLLSYMPRQRVSLEAMRDSMLYVSGNLDLATGGRPFADLTSPTERRRTVYAMVNRNDLPGMFRAFDFADPDSSAPSRPQTTVPQQALFFLNSDFVMEQTKSLADSIKTQDDKAVNELYARVLSRAPTPEEKRLAVEFVQSAKATTGGKEAKDQLSPWQQLAQVLLLTNEFVFVD
jgi:cytochrome c553